MSPHSPEAAKDVSVFQPAYNRQIRRFSTTYQRLCPSCGSVVGNKDYILSRAARGTVNWEVGTYKIADQNNRYDFYFVDLTGTWSGRRGDPDWGWMDVRVRNVGGVHGVHTSTSLGRTATNKPSCTTYPLNLSVGFKGVSASTKVAEARICNPGSKVSSKSIERGRTYHITGVSGFAGVQMRRFIQVRQGKLPQFEVNVTHNAEYVTCATGAAGYQCWLVRAKGSKTRTIGTSRQS